MQVDAEQLLQFLVRNMSRDSVAAEKEPCSLPQLNGLEVGFHIQLGAERASEHVSSRIVSGHCCCDHSGAQGLVHLAVIFGLAEECAGFVTISTVADLSIRPASSTREAAGSSPPPGVPVRKRAVKDPSVALDTAFSDGITNPGAACSARAERRRPLLAGNLTSARPPQPSPRERPAVREDEQSSSLSVLLGCSAIGDVRL